MSTLQSCSRRVLACRSTSKSKYMLWFVMRLLIRKIGCLRSFATEAPTPSTLSTSIILNRSPILTPKPGPLEQSYYAYQYKLQRALSTPFPQHFYFKRGVNLQQRFHNEEKDRDAKSFGAGFGKGPRLRLPPLPFDKPMPRETEADRTNDVKSLDRKGDRNLYLVLKKQADSSWRLPQGRAAPGEALHVVSPLLFNASRQYLKILGR